ncbi:unnamed protein product [Heterobilharzia americana]|nr:unnamed protein product [Heterobilharzia americana]CAH8660880.1 unnamed protein product [Heterobilharzia americana]
MPKSNKKGSKRLKISRKKRKTILEIKIDKFCSDEEKYADFLKRSSMWMTQNEEQLRSLLHLTVQYSDINFTYDDFKAALLSLNCPFTKLELDVITRLLDRDKNGFIEYEDLASSLISLSIKDGALKIKNIEKIEKSERGWVVCKFHCLNCINIHDSPLHFERIIQLNTFTEGLVSMIRQETLLWLPKISIFLSANEEPESELQTELMLSDYDLKSGAKYDAPQLDLFYRPIGKVLSNDSCTDKLSDVGETLQADPILWSKLVTENTKFHEKSIKFEKLLILLNSNQNASA